MPQIANLVLTDRAATPVNRTFTPRNVERAKGTLVHSSGVPVGESRLTIASNVTPAGKQKVTVNLTMPVVATETINGVSNPRVVRTNYASAEFSFDATSTEQERKDVVGMLQSVFDSSKWTNDVLTKLEFVY